LSLNPSGVCIPRCDTDAGLICARTFPSFPFCDPVSGQCVGCASDSDCPGTEVCNGGICVASCVFDAGVDSCAADSPHGPFAYDDRIDYCDTFTGLCVGCLDDYDCSPGGRCQPGTSVCVQCLNDADCPGNPFVYANFPICETDAGICGNCLQSSDCYPLGLAACSDPFEPDHCTDDGCLDGPTASNCPAPLACSSGLCGCSSDSDCLVFDSGVVPTCVHSGNYVPADAGPLVCGCDATSVCPDGEICDPRLGTPGGACVPTCSSDGGLDCATGPGYPACNPATGYCVECLTDLDCANAPNFGGYLRPVCVMDGGQPGFPVLGGGQCGCTTDDDCNGQLCDDGECN
jgi:Cys-rich repeat protein